MGVFEKLTEKEKEVLSHLCKGSLNKEISIQLNISVETVKKHNKNIFKKIGARNRAEVIILCNTYAVKSINE